jgi:NADPH-dependent F420 reductase
VSAQPHVAPRAVAVVGGTGPQGKGLAFRLARAGHRVVIGSRSAPRAAEVAEEISARLGAPGLVGSEENAAAATAADVVLLAVPYAGHDELVEKLAEQLTGKIVISCVNPLGFDKGGPYGLVVPGGSAAETAQELVPGARLVGAFHHLAAASLWAEDARLDHEDVLVCSDDAEAEAVVMALAQDVTGGRAIDAGRLRLARQLEPLTAVLISVNKSYQVRSGIRVTGLE